MSVLQMVTGDVIIITGEGFRHCALWKICATWVHLNLGRLHMQYRLGLYDSWLGLYAYPQNVHTWSWPSCIGSLQAGGSAYWRIELGQDTPSRHLGGLACVTGKSCNM